MFTPLAPSGQGWLNPRNRGSKCGIGFGGRLLCHIMALDYRLGRNAVTHDCRSNTVKLSEAKILEVYALRWSIEVYFKEIKQNLGFFKEQSGRYQLAYASVHLAALRYLLLFEAMLRGGRLNYGELRDRESGRLQTLTYAALLWQLFRALIEGALEGLVRDLGRKVVKTLLAAIDQAWRDFSMRPCKSAPNK